MKRCDKTKKKYPQYKWGKQWGGAQEGLEKFDVSGYLTVNDSRG